ncbi:hypothetical protein EJV46_01285 [Roseococcus sp. SYP-B2431]|uniref:TauD/TfdA family dioxygenase n=1 Tax=Roseococcus sp. SYP-B2431 TaxID=2496640 RepID=UPI0010405F1C|nr:hypothetical protein EJV46_01285 [Roseococcus sp. SYP-B2431]
MSRPAMAAPGWRRAGPRRGRGGSFLSPDYGCRRRLAASPGGVELANGGKNRRLPGIRPASATFLGLPAMTAAFEFQRPLTSIGFGAVPAQAARAPTAPADRAGPVTGWRARSISASSRRWPGWRALSSGRRRDRRAKAESGAHAPHDPGRLVHVHEWTAGDLVIWNNRCLAHAATWFDAEK